MKNERNTSTTNPGPSALSEQEVAMTQNQTQSFALAKIAHSDAEGNLTHTFGAARIDDIEERGYAYIIDLGPVTTEENATAIVALMNKAENDRGPSGPAALPADTQKAIDEKNRELRETLGRRQIRRDFEKKEGAFADRLNMTQKFSLADAEEDAAKARRIPTDEDVAMSDPTVTYGETVVVAGEDSVILDGEGNVVADPAATIEADEAKVDIPTVVSEALPSGTDFRCQVAPDGDRCGKESASVIRRTDRTLTISFCRDHVDEGHDLFNYYDAAVPGRADIPGNVVTQADLDKAARVQADIDRAEAALSAPVNGGPDVWHLYDLPESKVADRALSAMMKALLAKGDGLVETVTSSGALQLIEARDIARRLFDEWRKAASVFMTLGALDTEPQNTARSMIAAWAGLKFAGDDEFATETASASVYDDLG